MTLGDGGAITNDVLKFRKIIEFQTHKLSWAASELCTCLIIDKKDHLIFKKLVKSLQIK